jgi:hypothetical protein
MNYNTKYRVKLLASLILFFASSIDAKVSTAALAGGADIAAAAFDSANGVWYLGSGAANGTSTLASVGPFDGSTTPTFTALATNALLTSKAIDKLVLSYLPSTTTAVLALHENTTNTDAIGLYKAGTALPVFIDITDCDATPDAVVAADIRDIAISPTHFFVMVNNGSANFGDDADSGIRAYAFTTDLVITTHDTTAVASFLNTEHWIDGNCTNAPTIVSASTPKAVWHPGVSRLYAGISGASNATAANDIFVSLSCWYMSANLTITNVPIIRSLSGTPTAASVGLGTAATTGLSSIIGVKNAGAASIAFSIGALAPMTTSTGKNYIIVNGGTGALATTRAKVFALPLCDNGSATEIGALAKVTDTTNGLVDFGLPANSTDGLDLYNEDSVPAIVGGAALPILISETVRQMTVVGDTVYCSIDGTNGAGALGAGSESGVVYSQAIFNDTGAICGWTQWAKAAPNDLTGTTTTDGACFAFAVDAARGRIWTIDNALKTTVNVNQWTRPTALTTFGGQINSKLTGGCYSMFHLGSHTLGLADQNTNRYTLFGGDNQVIAVRVGTSTAALTSPEIPTNDWAAVANAAVNVTSGLENVGPVTALGWLGETGGADENYIFAGTNKGLYALAQADENGFNTTTLAADLVAMNIASSIFSIGKFFPLTAITEPVTKIVNFGHATDACAFVLTHGKDGVDKIWKVAGGANTTITILNNDIAAIGTTGLAGDDFANVKRIYDIELVSQNGVAGTTYELVASTDLGLFITTAAPLAVATTAATANWTQITDTSHVASLLSTPQRTRRKQTLWGVDYAYDASTGNPVIKSRLSQLGVNSTSLTRTFTPAAGFTSNSTLYFDSINRATAFSSVGALRFMANRVRPDSNTDYSLLNVLPYKVGSTDANMTALTAIPDTVCLATSTKAIYWVGDVGAGHIMAGTDDGVIVLN